MWEKEKMLVTRLPAFSLFPHNVFKGYFSQELLCKALTPKAPNESSGHFQSKNKTEYYAVSRLFRLHVL